MNKSKPENRRESLVLFAHSVWMIPRDFNIATHNLRLTCR
jgi:hypothetical protein